MALLKFLRSGDLDRLVTIESMSDVHDDDYGGVTESPTQVASVWAHKRELAGRELLSAQQISAEIKTIWTIRYRDDITRTHQLTHEGVIYDIYHIDEIGRRVGLELWCGARVT